MALKSKLGFGMMRLPIQAGACVRCGHCESRCPFHVKQEARMEEINHYFSFLTC